MLSIILSSLILSSLSKVKSASLRLLRFSIFLFLKHFIEVYLVGYVKECLFVFHLSTCIFVLLLFLISSILQSTHSINIC